MSQTVAIALRVTLITVISPSDGKVKVNTFGHYFYKALIKVLGFYQNFSRQFDQHMKLTYNLRKYRPLQ